MTALYMISKYITFPGAYMKGFFEHIVCRMLKADIYSAEKYVKNNALSGHVYIIPPTGAAKSFLVCFLPGLFNFILGAASYAVSIVTLGFLGVRYWDIFSGTRNPMFFVYCVLLYFSASIMCNLFPYYEDAEHMWKKLYGKKNRTPLILKILLFIPSAVILVGAYIERYALSLLINIALTVCMFALQ
ncbi:MAG: hypothetical protein K6F09_02065 [Clostridiales bacterium]|nr:hypothetical protein [Clostridiales bacterium]